LKLKKFWKVDQVKKIIIHIGTEKTGTTSIQEYLNVNRSTLSEHYGILYPDFGCSSMGHFELVAALHPMCNSGRRAEFARHQEFDPDTVWDEFCEKIIISKQDVIIISSEHFSSRLNAAGVAFIKKKLDENLPEYEVEIVVYLRNQVDMFQSSYSTYIKTGGTKSILELFKGLDGNGTYYNFYNLVKLWSDYFGKNSVIVRNFNALVKDGGVVADLLSYLDVNSFSVDTTVDKNSTWNPVFLEFARNLNSGVLRDEDHGVRYSKYESILRKYTCFSSFNEFCVLPNEISVEVETLFLASNVKLNDFLGCSNSESYFESWKPKKTPYDYDNFSTHLSEVLLSGFDLVDIR
jgi:hypothetical protein